MHNNFLLMRIIAILLIFLCISTPILAETMEVLSSVTLEARTLNFWQEADITFWQTLPFAALWGYFIDRQLSSFMYPGSEAHWRVILPFAVVVSAGNAMLHAREVIRGKTD